jgi:hypothetical protein
MQKYKTLNRPENCLRHPFAGRKLNLSKLTIALRNQRKVSREKPWRDNSKKIIIIPKHHLKGNP